LAHLCSHSFYYLTERDYSNWREGTTVYVIADLFLGESGSDATREWQRQGEYIVVRPKDGIGKTYRHRDVTDKLTSGFFTWRDVNTGVPYMAVGETLRREGDTVLMQFVVTDDVALEVTVPLWVPTTVMVPPPPLAPPPPPIPGPVVPEAPPLPVVEEFGEVRRSVATLLVGQFPVDGSSAAEMRTMSAVGASVARRYPLVPVSIVTTIVREEVMKRRVDQESNASAVYSGALSRFALAFVLSNSQYRGVKSAFFVMVLALVMCLATIVTALTDHVWLTFLGIGLSVVFVAVSVSQQVARYRLTRRVIEMTASGEAIHSCAGWALPAWLSTWLMALRGVPGAG
jgi:hypothetical protein